MSQTTVNSSTDSDGKPALINPDEVVSNLQHPDSEIRLRAVKDLISLREKSDIERLNKLLEKETDVQICYEIRKGISILRQTSSKGKPAEITDFSNNLKKVQEALESEDDEISNRAFRYIVQYRLKQFLPALEEHCLKRPSSYRKGLLIRLMVSLGGELYFSSLVSFLNDDDPRVISTAIEALEGIGNTRALGFIAQFVTHSNNRVQATAMKALYNLGDQSAIKLFRKMVGSSHVAYRNSAAYALKEMKIPESIPLLRSLYQDEDPSVKDKAREGLEQLADMGIEEAGKILDQDSESTGSEPASPPEKMSTPELMDWIRDQMDPNDFSIAEKLLSRLKIEQDERLIASLILALARTGSPEIARELRPYLSSPTDRIRANAVEGLGAVLLKQEKEILIPSLEDLNNRVVGNAIIALVQDYPDQALSGLEGLSQSSNLNEQLTAVYCIGAIGTEDILRYSEFLLESPFTEVREKMVKVLEDLSQDSAVALRILKGFQLRMASFDPDDQNAEKVGEEPIAVEFEAEEEQPDDQETDSIDEESLSEPGHAEDQTILPAPPSQSSLESKSIKSTPKRQRKKHRRGEEILDQMELDDSLEFFASQSTGQRISSALFFLFLASLFLINLCSALIQDQFTFYRIFSMPLRMVLINDFLFSAFFILILPGIAFWFFCAHWNRYSQEPFLLSFLAGLFLHQYVQIVDIMQVPVAPLLNFLSSDIAVFYFEKYSGNARFASQVLSLPWLLLPLAIEGVIRLRGFRKGMMGAFSSVLVLTTIWLIYLNQYASTELARVKIQKQRNLLLYQKEQVEGLISQSRLETLSLEARIIKASNQEQKRYLSGKLQRIQSQSKRYTKMLESLKDRIQRVEQ